MKRIKTGLFTRYLAAFMAIIAISFGILAALIISMVNSYATDTKQETVRNCAISVNRYLDEGFSSFLTLNPNAAENYNQGFNNYVYFNKEALENSLTMLADNYENLMILVADKEGSVLVISENTPPEAMGYAIPSESIGELTAEEGSAKLSDFNGLFEERYLSVAYYLYGADDKSYVGTIIVSSDPGGLSSLLQNMLKTIIIFCLVVFLAALVSLYFITERITSPLKLMSKAAKSYAAGKFDVRVPISGNDEVANLAIAFNNMANSMANVEDLRRSFLANVAHDLRTPMTTIAGFIDGILDGAIPPDKQPYYLELIASEVRRLSRLVSSLLDISRIQAGDRKFTSSDFDICEMARQILISFESQIDEKKLEVEFECDEDSMIAYADSDAIHQVLYNICHNAVKFSRPGGLYRISIGYQEKKILVSVRNDGVGIPKGDLPFVFDRFYKSDKSRGLDKTGVGLGLYIVKTIISAHNEDIWVDSVEGEYCEFSFTLLSSKDK